MCTLKYTASLFKDKSKNISSYFSPFWIKKYLNCIAQRNKVCWSSILVSLANAPRCRYVLKHMDNSHPSCPNRYSQIIPYLSLIKEDYSANRYKNWRFLSKFVSIHQKERKIRFEELLGGLGSGPILRRSITNT